MNLDELLVMIVERDLRLAESNGRLQVLGDVTRVDQSLRDALAQHRSTLLEMLATHENLPSSDICSLDRAPLTPNQLGLIRHYLTEVNDNSYHMPIVVRLRGGLRVALLREAFADIVRRHPTLAARYVNDENGGWQQRVVGRSVVMDVVVASDTDAAIKSFIDQPFDLAAGEVFRARLFHVEHDHHILVCVVHHIAADGWSAEILKRDLCEAYRSRFLGCAIPAPPTMDFFQAADRIAKIRSREIERDKAFWREYLAGADQVAEIAYAPSSEVEAPVFTHIIPGMLQQAVTAIAGQLQVTPYQMIVAALGTCLWRITRGGDIVVCRPQSNRTVPGSEDVVGLLLDALPMRLCFTEGLMFSDLCRQVARDSELTSRHASLAMAEILELSGIAGGRDLHPWQQVCVNLLDFDQESLRLEGLSVEELDVVQLGAKYALTLYLTRGTDGWCAQYHVRGDRFSESAVALLHAHFLCILQAVCADPATCLEEIGLAGPEPVQMDTIAAPMQPVPALFRQAVARYPAAPALWAADGVVSYAQLAQRVDAVATHLVTATQGVDADAIVVILARRDEWLVVSMLACLQAGRTYTVIDADAPHERQRQMLAHLPVAGWLLTDVDLQPLVQQFGVVVPYAVVSALACAESTVAGSGWMAHREDQPACVTFTSGSTAQPRGVIGRHGALTMHLPHLCERYGISPTDRFAMVGGLMSDPLQRDVFTPLCLGGSVAIPRPGDLEPGRFSAWLAASATTIVNLTPGLVRFATTDVQPGLHLSCLRWVMVCGDTLYWNDVAALRTLAPDAGVVNLYGMTESQRALSEFVCAEPGMPIPACDGIVPIGRTGARTTIMLCDRNGRSVGWGEPGELMLTSDGLALGYLCAGAESAARFLPADGGHRVLRTGDSGRYLPDGSVHYLGRLDHQVNINGVRFAPIELEACVSAWPDVAACKVVVQRNDDGATELTLYWVPAGTSVAPSEIRRRLRRSLPAAMVPTHVFELAELPLNAAGKIAPERLTSLARPESDQDVLDPFASSVAALWAEVLGQPVRSLNEDFFLTGGSSLTALRLCERISQVFGKPYSVMQLFEHPSLRSCVEHLRHEPLMSVEPTTVEAATLTSGLFALTEVQQAYWVGRADSLAGGGIGTGSYLEFTVPLNCIQCIEPAIDTLVRRHPMLRATITGDGHQQVNDTVPSYCMPMQDLRAVEIDTRMQALSDWREEMSGRVFASDRWPLFDIRVSHWDDGAVLHVAMDMLMVDFNSSRILALELDALLRGVELPPAPTYEFADHVRALEERRTSSSYRAARSYWLERIDTLPLGPSLPMAVKLPDKPVYVRRSLRVTEAQWARIGEGARDLGVTRAAVLLTVYASVLATWSEDRRMSLIVTLYDRNDLVADAARTIGDFTSLLLLELDLPEISFADCVRHVQQRLITSLQHRSFGAVSVLRELSQKRGHGAPLFVPFVFTDTLDQEQAATDSAPLLLRERYRYSRTSQVWIDHTTTRDKDGVGLHWTCVDDVFAPGVIDAMFSGYEKALAEIARVDSNWRAQPVQAALRVQQRHREEYNRTHRPLPSSRLEALFVAQARRTPDATALICGSITLSYSQLLAHAQALSKRLRCAGVGRGEPVAVVLPKGSDQVIAVLGILLADAAYLPIDPSQPTARIERMLAQAQVEYAVIAADAMLTLRSVHRLPVFDDDQPSTPVETPVAVGSADEVAYIIFTSGSTGEPKGVVTTHAAVTNTILDINSRFAVGAADRVLAVSSLSFDLSVYDIFGTLAVGAAIVMPTADEMTRPSSWSELVSAHRVTIWNSVPALLQVFCDRYSDDDMTWPASLRLVLLSGDWIPLQLAERLRKKSGITLVSLGGATEAAIWSIFHVIEAIDPTWRSIPYGRPLANQTIEILRDDGSTCPDCVIGEIHIGGVGLAREYCGDSSQTSCAFVTHPATGERLYRTGDLGRFCADGRLELLGRRDHQVKLAGHRIELGEIEAALRELPDVEEAVAVIRSETGAPTITAFLVDSSTVPVDEATLLAVDEATELRSRLLTRLPAPMLPRNFVRLIALPLSSNGKVDRGKLARMPLLHDELERQDEGIAAMSQLETEIAALWSEHLLSQTAFGRGAEFFALGGNSLAAMRVLNRLRQHYGVAIGIGDFYRNERLADLADLVERRMLLNAVTSGISTDTASTDRLEGVL